ncbi:MAG TPA: hypothetical protein VGD68_09080 [Streptosporangiaceae bacterium]
MIRRVFWLSVGAAAGITGYRRASAAGRAVQVRVTGKRPAPPAGPFWPPRAIEPGSAPMPDRYAERSVSRSPAVRRAPQPASWSATRTAWRTSRAAWRVQKNAVAGVRTAGRFAQDVREGMDVYMSRQDD